MKRETPLKPAFVFADESGKLSDPNEDLVILTALIIYGTKTAQVSAHFDHLKNLVAKWGIDTDDPKFEFHSEEIFNRRERWRNLSDEKIERLAKFLRNSVRVPGLSFVVVLIDKRKRGFDSFLQLIKHSYKEMLSNFTEDQLARYNRLLAEHGIRKGIGETGQAASLLFGLTTALMHWEGFKGETKVIPDDQFLNGIEAWQFIYAVNSVFFDVLWSILQPELEKEPTLPKWSKKDPPKWHLGSTVDPADSREYFGLQLADFIAYTSRKVSESGGDIASRYALLGDRDFVSIPFRNSDGVKVIVSSKPRIRTRVIPFAAKKRWRWLFYRKVYSRY
ncbi:MAG: DUF3800 domain-containing protein [Dehalococcoidia bacterium]|jgi:hypothetical protein